MGTDRSWALDRPLTSPFASPRGLRGRLAGRIMRRFSTHTELLDLLDIQPGDRILEIGFGPGALLRLLADTTPAGTVAGVDPSPDMITMARRHTRHAADRVRLDTGTAAHTGHPDAAFDQIVTANTVAIWPDLDAGLRECHRVLRPGGRLLVAWHSATAPSRIARANSLPREKLDQLDAALRARFTEVTRHELPHFTAFTATRSE